MSDSLYKQASAAQAAGDNEAALKHLTDYLIDHPKDGLAWSRLGSILRTLKQHENALRAHRRAFELSPRNGSVANNLANILSDLGHYDESIRLRSLILNAKPDDTNQLSMIGRCLRSAGRYQDAINFLERALSAHPSDPEIRIQLAFAQLGKGDYKAGFANYDARWRTKEIKLPKLDFPRWSGQDLVGKRVLVMPEQGFGDFILTIRLLPLLKSRGAHVSVLAKKPLLPLLGSLKGCDEVRESYSKSEKFDYWLSLFDLPLLGLEDRDDIPEPTKLQIPDDSIERARTFTAPYIDSFKIGVVWTGSTTYKGNSFRSFSHRDFLPLTDLPRAQLFSLYKGPELAPYEADGTAALILNAAAHDRHFGDCAAMMREMDLVITSDTATAHIAGSLGIPTWVLLHWDSFWVYTHTGTTTPWYPSMRLFRQPVPRDWQSVQDAVLAALDTEFGLRA